VPDFTYEWFPPLDELYSKLENPGSANRSIFQGDVFKDVPCRRYPAREGVDPVDPRGKRGYAMVLGHPCEISAEEKGSGLAWRLVCPVAEDRDRRLTLNGEGDYYAFPLPSLVEKDDLWYADFRFLSTVHVEELPASARVAALSEPGWYALQRRLVHYLTRVQVHWLDLQDVGAGLHPDAAA
jgi:hypothetical protein